MNRLSLLFFILFVLYGTKLSAQYTERNDIAGMVKYSVEVSHVSQLGIDEFLKSPLSVLPNNYPSSPASGYFLKKSKRQKRTAWILLGTGAALIGTGFVIGYTYDDNDPIGKALLVATTAGGGIMTSLISIPFFIAASRNKKKEEKITASVQFIQSEVLLQGIRHTAYPGLGIKVRL